MKRVKVDLSNTGSITRGSVLDCDYNAFDKIIKSYDNRLYVQWNPTKNGGLGTWELRIRPSLKVQVDQGGVGEAVVSTLEYKENPLTHHILDIPALDVNIRERLYEMDSTRRKNYSKEIDDEYVNAIDAQDEANEAQLRESIKENKKYWRQHMEAVKSGWDPFGFLYHK